MSVPYYTVTVIYQASVITLDYCREYSNISGIFHYLQQAPNFANMRNFEIGVSNH